DAWVYDSSGNRAGQFIRDHWNRRIMEMLGQPAPKSNWVHLYLNGLYWGVYNPTERPDTSFSQSRHGGNEENFDSIKNHEEVLAGSIASYRNLLGLIQKDSGNFNKGYRDLSNPFEYREVLPFIEVVNLADYMIHNMYSAARDWPGNFYIGYDRSGDHGGWWFYDWDNEHGLKGSVNENRTRPHSRDADSPTKFHHALRVNPEYRMMFADRIQRAFFNGGPLYVDPENPHFEATRPGKNRPAALWMEMTSKIETALIAESARWGDYRKSRPYTVHNEFKSLRDNLLRNWFPRRSSIVLQQFQSMGLFPLTEAPILSRFTGVIPEGYPLTITAPSNETIYYTINGSDPRLPSESEPGISTDAQIYSDAVSLEATSEIKARVFNGTEWSALTEASLIVGTPSSASTLVISEIMYHAASGTALDFIEVMNISKTKVIDLTNVRFTTGISFTFPFGTTLAPLSRIVVVDSETEFKASYGSLIDIAGQYTGKLDNGGERIEILDWQGEVIKSFDYDDDGKWPSSADGGGASLRLKTPRQNPPHGKPEHWLASSVVGGTPGMPDDVSFSGDPSVDLDGDGIVALLEYVFGLSDSVPNSDSMIRFSIDGEFPTFSFQRDLGVTDVIIRVEWSKDLEDWESGEDFVQLVSEEINEDGTVTVVYRTMKSMDSTPTQFLRLLAK
ncbi:lamin tail domain-containing protein, partial [Verrucomicrobia bacterium]|nr:lamin tail domain-containing protein [Verrucomicrobiota bacterium]